ncbi:MAG: hypothetical protein QOD66_752 [Solirubrobacteraceae bacterium]|nr:hypothetical protein [Solirubrobacteraceae bacterium]
MRRPLASGALATALTAVAGAAVAIAAPAPAHQAVATRAAPAVKLMVVGRSRTLLSARGARLRSGTIRIGARRCSVPSGTPLAGLLAARLSLGVTDAGGCDPSALFVTRIGPDRNHGIAGWQYKVGPVSPSFGAGDPGQRLRDGAQLLWFWCVRATACQRTLALKRTSSAVPTPGATFIVSVVGYDDNGHARPVSGAAVRLGGEVVISGTGGLATLTAPGQPGRYAITAMKSGLVPSFALQVQVK